MASKTDRSQAWLGYLKRTAQGDQRAFASFFDESSPIAYGIALRALHNAADAEDLVVDAYTQIWNSASRFEASRGTPLAWLVSIVRSRSIDRLRSRARCRLDDDSALARMCTAEDGPAQAFDAVETAGLLRRALSQIPASNRRVLELLYFEGMTHPQIAEWLGEPVSTVKTRSRRGLKMMKALVEPWRRPARPLSMWPHTCLPEQSGESKKEKPKCFTTRSYFW